MELEQALPTGKGPADHFTGDVWVDSVAEPRPDGAKAGIVHFTPGARTAWHAHATGQSLRVLEGTAIVQTRDGHTIVADPGQTVHTGPGEWHWHGATETGFMSHLALSATGAAGAGPDVTWAEQVDDTTYRTAHHSSHQKGTIDD